MRYKMIKNDPFILTLEFENNKKITIYSDDKLQLIDSYSVAARKKEKNQ